MITKHRHRNLTWVDLESPTPDEIRSVGKEYKLNVLVTQDLAAPSLKPKVDLYANFVYLILHFPRIQPNQKRDWTESRVVTDQEIDFIVGKKFLITVHYESSDVMHTFSKTFDAHAIIDKNDIGPHAGFVFFELGTRLYEALANELAAIHDALRQIENKIFGGEEQKMVLALSKVSRELLDFERSLFLHRAILESFETAGRKFFGEEFRFHLRTLSGSYYRTEHAAESSAEFLKELRETNNSLVSTKQNEIMKVLTIMAFVTFPLSLIASIFGMNTRALPIIGLPGDFWIVIGIMALCAASFFWYFKHKRWL